MKKTLLTVGLLATLAISAGCTSMQSTRYSKLLTAEREGMLVYRTGSRIPRFVGDDPEGMKSHQNLRTYDQEDLKIGRPIH